MPVSIIQRYSLYEAPPSLQRLPLSPPYQKKEKIPKMLGHLDSSYERANQTARQTLRGPLPEKTPPQGREEEEEEVAIKK